jgi:NAD(P)-dependent dehydrogenase (short-subunit alcohol dehydrogenase family)
MMDRRTFIAAGLAATWGTTRAQVPHSSFTARSTAAEVTAGLNLTGKTAVVTGCTSGLGFEPMRVLALRGAHVIATGRTIQEARAATAKVRGTTTPLMLELSDFASVRACAARICALTARIDVLMLNAGIALDRPQQVRGLEKQFVVNHLGHFLLTSQLIDLLKASARCRVVTVGSESHLQAPAGGIQFSNLSGKGWEDKAYAHSKLANGLFSHELARRLRDSRVASNCLTPGPVHTAIFDGWAAPVTREAKIPVQGAATQCYVATARELGGVTGKYFKDCNPAAESEYQRSTSMAARLWEVSERRVA